LPGRRRVKVTLSKGVCVLSRSQSRCVEVRYAWTRTSLVPGTAVGNRLGRPVGPSGIICGIYPRRRSARSGHWGRCVSQGDSLEKRMFWASENECFSTFVGNTKWMSIVRCIVSDLAYAGSGVETGKGLRVSNRVTLELGRRGRITPAELSCRRA